MSLPMHARTTTYSSQGSSDSSTVPTSKASHVSYSAVDSSGPAGAPFDTNALPAGPVNLPLSLPKPDHVHEVDVSTLAFDSDLSAVPPSYIAEKIKAMAGDELLATTAHAHISIPSEAQDGLTPLPSHLLVESDTEGFAPTHVLAVHGRDSVDTLLLPIHGAIYAISCTTLSHLARTRPAVDDARLLPVTHVHVPSAASFPLLHSWLTARSSPALLAWLWPMHALSSSGKTTVPLKPALVASKLASGASLEDLTRHVHLCHGLWANVVALGIADEALWNMMQLGWQVLVGALTLRGPRSL